MKLTCDVLIVGAGPAGLSAASILSKNGFTTVVLERNKTVGNQQTSYDITEGSRIQKILNEMGIKPLKKSPVSEWFSPNHNFILDSKIDDYYFKRGTEKDSIENILLKKLSKNYTKILFESHINTLELKKKQVTEVTVKTADKKINIKPKYIIGADGAQSDLRSKLRIEIKTYATFRGSGLVVESKEQDQIPHAKIYFDEQYAPGGYIYSGSIDNKSFFCVVIDDIFSEKIKLRENLQRFLKEKINGKIIAKNYFDGIGISGIHKNYFKNVFFVGGSALFYDPFLGYGLNYAIESAYVASQTIISNKLQMYKKYVKVTQQEIKKMYKIRQIWRKMDNAFFDRLLLALNGKYNNKNDTQINQIIDLLHE